MDHVIADKQRIVDGSGYTVLVGPGRASARPATRRSALLALTGGRRVVYAMRVPDGAIKIGTTVDLPNRLSALHAELLGFTFADLAHERALQSLLAAHLLRGREFFRPTPEVFAVVNEMRDEWNLPHIAA